MAIEPSDATTTFLAHGTEESVIVLRYGPDFMDELQGLVESKQHYELVIVDVVKSGFLFPTEILLESLRQAQSLLSVQGVLVFVKADKIVALVRESLAGVVTIHLFNRLSELYDYSPWVAQHVQSVLGKDANVITEGSDLAEQMLLSSTPVLTSFGIKLKAGMESSRRRNIVLGAIDNHTPLSGIAQRLVSLGKLTLEDLKEEMRSLEQVKAIYPIFAKVPFLVHCFRNRIPFKLRDYLIASRLLTQDQLDEMIVEQNKLKVKERLSLGAMAVSKGYFSTRQLEIALQDQAFYGQVGESEKVKMAGTTGQSMLVQSLVGHLGTTDPAGLLQSLATNRETGVLSVEYQDKQFRALFEQGRLTHARIGSIQGNRAIIEFVSLWKEGVFVFIQRKPPPGLTDESSKLSKPLDKLLLDSALASDNMEVVLKKLPKGFQTTLENVPDTNNLWQSSRMVDPKEKVPIEAYELAVMHRLWSTLDGLTPLTATIKALEDVTTYDAATAIDRLLYYGLVTIPATSVAGPLDRFREIANGVGKRIGHERNVALLRLSLQAAHGYSVRARIFTIGNNGEVGIDFIAARSSQTSLSIILKDLEGWQLKFIEYASQEIDPEVLKSIVMTAR